MDGCVRSADGDELGPVLDEQATYYQAIAGEYYDHYLDLPGGEELTAALDAFRPAGSSCCASGCSVSAASHHCSRTASCSAWKPGNT